MKQHIAGFILFNFIVTTSVVVAVLFYSVPGVDSVRAPETPNNYVKTSCWRSRSHRNAENSAKITQSVFNNKTNEIKTELFMQSKEKSFQDVKVILHFFVKEGNSTRYLASEDLADKKMDMQGSFDMSERRITKATFVVTSSFYWLDELESRDNLYIVPQIISNLENSEDYTPVFDEANATPVTVVH